MSLWATVIAAAASIGAFFAWANRQTAKAHARFTYKDVEIALAELLDPQAHDHDTRDLFLAWSINDPYLESIRLECQRIFRERPPVPGKDINAEGGKRVAALLAELPRRTNPDSSSTDVMSASQ